MIFRLDTWRLCPDIWGPHYIPRFRCRPSHVREIPFVIVPGQLSAKRIERESKSEKNQGTEERAVIVVAIATTSSAPPLAHTEALLPVSPPPCHSFPGTTVIIEWHHLILRQENECSSADFIWRLYVSVKTAKQIVVWLGWCWLKEITVILCQIRIQLCFGQYSICL